MLREIFDVGAQGGVVWREGDVCVVGGLLLPCLGVLEDLRNAGLEEGDEGDESKGKGE